MSPLGERRRGRVYSRERREFQYLLRNAESLLDAISTPMVADVKPNKYSML